MIRGLIASLMVLASAVSAQEQSGPVAPADQEAEALTSTRAYLCRLGAEIVAIPFLEVGEAELEARGAFAGWQVRQAGSRISIVSDDSFLQIDGANSLAVVNGDLLQGECIDVSMEVQELIAVALGGSPDEMISSLRDTWVGRAQSAEAQVSSLESQVVALRRTQTPCTSQAPQLIAWIARDLPRLEQPDMPDGERHGVVQTMRSRVASLQRLCGGE